MIQGTGHGTQCLGADMDIPRRGFELLVPKQFLNDANVSALLQKVGGKTVSEQVQCHFCIQPGDISGLMQGAIELPSANSAAPVVWK